MKIKDYTSELEAYRDCLGEMKKLHGRFKAAVDLNEKNRKHALCLLAGASVDAAYAAFDQYSKGYIVGVHQLARFVLEMHSLAEHFLVIDEKPGGDIEKWFGGEFIKTRYRKNTRSKIEKTIEQKAGIPFKTLPKDQLLKWEEALQHSFDELSRFSHPTIYSTKQPKTDFGQLILIPIMDILVDAQRLYFFPTDSVTGLMFSEFRLFFRSFGEHDRKTSSNEPSAGDAQKAVPHSQHSHEI